MDYIRDLVYIKDTNYVNIKCMCTRVLTRCAMCAHCSVCAECDHNLAKVHSYILTILPGCIACT